MRSLRTSLRILSAFCGEQASWSVTELAKTLCLEKALVSKNLACFRDLRFLQQDARTKAYSSGLATEDE
jgi:DNA-binding IclR family transcriptional regulator